MLEKKNLENYKETLLQEKETLQQKRVILERENEKLRENLREYQRSLDQCEIRQDKRVPTNNTVEF